MEEDKMVNQDMTLEGVGDWQHLASDDPQEYNHVQEFQDQLQAVPGGYQVAQRQPTPSAVQLAKEFTLDSHWPEVVLEDPEGNQRVDSSQPSIYLSFQSPLPPRPKGFAPTTISNPESSLFSYIHTPQSFDGTDSFTTPTNVSLSHNGDYSSTPYSGRADAAYGFREIPYPVGDTDPNPFPTQHGSHYLSPDATAPQARNACGATILVQDLPPDESIATDNYNRRVDRQPLGNTAPDNHFAPPQSRRRNEPGSPQLSRSQSDRSTFRSRRSAGNGAAAPRTRQPSYGGEAIPRPPPVTAHSTSPVYPADLSTNADDPTHKPARGVRRPGPLDSDVRDHANKNRIGRSVCFECNQSAQTCKRGDPPAEICFPCQEKKRDCREAQFVKHVERGTCFPATVVHHQQPNSQNRLHIYIDLEERMTEGLVATVNRAAAHCEMWNLVVSDHKGQCTIDLGKAYRDVKHLCQRASPGTKVQDAIDNDSGRRAAAKWSSYVTEGYDERRGVVKTMFRWLANPSDVTLDLVPKPSIYHSLYRLGGHVNSDIDSAVTTLIYRFLTRKLEVQGLKELKSKLYPKHNQNEPKAYLHAADAFSVLLIFRENWRQGVYIGAPGSSETAAGERAGEVCRTLHGLYFNLMRKVPPPDNAAWDRIDADDRREAEDMLRDAPIGETYLTTEERDVEFKLWIVHPDAHRQLESQVPSLF